MKPNYFILLFLLVSVLSFAQNNDSLVLVCNGSSNYKIQVETEIALPAANLLSNYIDSLTGFKIPLSPKKSNNHPSIIFRHSNGSSETILDDGFFIETKHSDLIIQATNGAGFSNAVYYLLENLFGCRYYAPGVQIIPKKKELKIGTIEILQNPAFAFRVNYNGGAFDPSFAKWHGLHNIPHKPEAEHFDISDNWGLWVHTFHKLVPTEKWFDSHPEYFALRNGVRIPDQLCLSNPDVLKIAIEELRKQMDLKPNAKYWSVSQMDNFNYCQCENCRAIDELNGSPSGSMIEFVNKVAEEFPDKVISTLAYQYTRKAPSQIKPLPNVNIMLCSIECNRDKPIAEDKSENGFRNDLEEWSKISDNIIVWDYVINFSNIIGPFPNFHVLKPNLQLFKEHHVQMIFEQGWPRPSGEFTELRCYLLSKLMWNPNLDADSLIKDFCLGFYGSGGENIYKYIKLSTQNLINSGKALTLYEPMSAHSAGFLSPENIEIYFRLMEKALEINNNKEPYNHRIQMAMQPLRYAWLEVAKSLPFTPNWIFVQNSQGNYEASERAQKMLLELYNLAKENGPTLFHETSISPKEYYDKMTTYFAKGVQMHKAVGKSIIFEKLYSPTYSANGLNSLIDGVCGTENYFCLWQGWYGENMVATIDFGNTETINSVALNCLINQLSWIFPPKLILLSGSDDGITYTNYYTITNYSAANKTKSGIFPFKIRLVNPKKCRYLKIEIQNIGQLPDWRGINGNAWLFIDEIIVN